MKRSLFAIKNLIWLIGIFLSLGVMFVALIIAAVTGYSGPIQRGGPILGVGEAWKQAEQQAAAAQSAPGGELIILGETKDGGQSYLDSLTLLVDSNLIGLRSYRILEELSQSAQVWGSHSEDIPADALDTIALEMSDGSLVSPAQAVQTRPPHILVISLGADGLVGVEKDRFIAGYEGLIRSIREVDPQLPIVVCSLSSVTVTYSGVSGLTPNNIREANEWIRQVCMNTGVYYCDAAAAVNDTAGWLMSDYASINGKTLNSSGIKAVLDYLCTHMVP